MLQVSNSHPFIHLSKAFTFVLYNIIASKSAESKQVGDVIHAQINHFFIW